MLMTRIVYVTVCSLLVLTNGAALIEAGGGRSFVTAALIANLLLWPLALVVAYRVGQATQRLADAKGHPLPGKAAAAHRPHSAN